MSRYKIVQLLLAVVLLLAIVGCSKEKKDEAAKLEQELLGDTALKIDSSLVDSAAKVAVDSIAEFQASAVPKEEPPKMMPKKPAGDGYTVQIAGCEDPDYADHLVTKYQKRGYEPYVTTVTVEGQTFYRVRIGVFATIAEARALQNELNDRFSAPTWVDVTVNSY